MLILMKVLDIMMLTVVYALLAYIILNLVLDPCFKPSDDENTNKDHWSGSFSLAGYTILELVLISLVFYAIRNVVSRWAPSPMENHFGYIRLRTKEADGFIIFPIIVALSCPNLRERFARLIKIHKP